MDTSTDGLAWRARFQECVSNPDVGGEFQVRARQASSPWPMYSWQPCSYDAYWDDLEPYRQYLVDELIRTWDLVTPELDRIFNEEEASNA